ncbi:NUDIX hydrolase domain-like protein [Epithele typhae]|uniref:NUDIX hydrolase domain-like protein n=1 Tax=Epithele typhae TaxID=378194 RepID=UPI002007A3F3|nr:NUDIX hydrolase domain-like protein [Epithele typhae]KAH9929564.1 NUDIX hydrolase domain-like protein [Epithele typhae]
MSTDPYVNFFSGNPLNRLSWLRTSQPFLNSIIHAPSTRWLVFNDGQPLALTPPDDSSSAVKQSLARLHTHHVRPLLGPEPFFAQGQNEGELAPEDVKSLEAARLRGAPILFLGLHETESSIAAALPSTDFSAHADIKTVIDNIKGDAYFSLDVTDVPKEEVDAVLKAAAVDASDSKLAFVEPRSAMTTLEPFEGAIFAEARCMVDWNARNKFCPSCGSPVHSAWAGWKLTCSTLLPWADNAGKKPCPTATGLNNFSHPRTDAVVIMTVINETGDKVLLGRNKRWPALFYSCMSGFIEPGESFEDAVQRELWEEAGVKVWDVRYHSSQPWPYPSTLMVGFHATASSDEPLRTDLDNELDEARWFTREEVLAVLAHAEGTRLSRADQKELAAAAEKTNPNVNEVPSAYAAAQAPTHPAGPRFKLPPLTAIGGVIIREWAHGCAGRQPAAAGSATVTVTTPNASL